MLRDSVEIFCWRALLKWNVFAIKLRCEGGFTGHRARMFHVEHLSTEHRAGL
jgi:hypothetical protein